MKHLILIEDTILQIGNNYSTPLDNDVKQLLNLDRVVHCLDGERYDYNTFQHIEVDELPEDITVGDKYLDGAFAKAEVDNE